MKKRDKLKKQLFHVVLFLGSVICIGLLIFNFSNGLSKLLYLYVVIIVIIPILAFYGKAKLYSCQPKEQLVVDSKGNITKQNRFNRKNYNSINSNTTNYTNSNDFTVNEQQRKYKPSQSPNVELESYKQVVNVFKNSIKNQLLIREDILKFKNQLNLALGENLLHYQDFKFKNDCHEIYVKIKNKHLVNEDYNNLLVYLNYLLGSKRNNEIKKSKVNC